MSVIENCIEDVDRYYPVETGGTFMGYWSDPNTAVVTASIEGGPNAVRERHHFEPDQGWQEKEIARHYERSERRETYIGDWHSHPGAMNGRLSGTDQKILRRIINTPSARAATPLMAVFHGGPSSWQLTLWRAALAPRTLLWRKLLLHRARVERY